MNPNIPNVPLDPLSENAFAKALIDYLKTGTDATKAMAKQAVAHYLDIQGTGNFHHVLSEELLDEKDPRAVGKRMRARVGELQSASRKTLRSLIGNVVDSRRLHNSKHTH